MGNFKILKQGETLYPSKVNAANIIDNLNVSLQNRLDNVGQITPTFNSGVTIATINGVDIKVPQEAMSVTITGTKFYTNFASLKSSTDSFEDGQILETKGYYTTNDGGGSRFLVFSSQDELVTDDATLVQLVDGHYAEIMLPASNVLNFRQFGARTSEQNIDDSGVLTDCKPYILKYLDYINRKNVISTLVIPGGIWQFSPTDLNSTVGFRIIGENTQSALMPGKTAIVPMSGATQNYVWKISGKNINIGQLNFTNQTAGLGSLFQMGATINNDVQQRTYQDATCYRSVIIDGVTDSTFSSLYFTLLQNALDISNTTNTYFGFLNIRQSGGKFNNVRSVIRLGDNIEGVYFDYLNAEHIRGNVFYGYGTDINAPTQFILNNLQMEGTHPNAGDTSISDPGYNHNISHWFVFNGKLGSKTRPCMVTNISISNLSSFYSADSTSYKTMAIFGHETDVPMGFVIGNVFTIANESGPWFIYDKVKGASFTFNQPVFRYNSLFYLQDASMPLINTSNRRQGIIQAAWCGERVSYKNGSYSDHELVGSNNTDEYYVLNTLGNDGLTFRFYHSANESTTIIAVVEKYQNDQWTSAGTFNLTCSSTTGWQAATISNLNINIPLKIRIKGLPKYVDYFINYENV